MEITVLRYGHRKKRDDRASMHVALVARALGAKEIVYCGQKDEELEERVRKVCEEWGGKFKIEYVEDWIEYAKNFDGVFVHLTMYGEQIQKKVQAIRGEQKHILIMVGSQKVPIEAYQVAKYNIAITNQPHSEIAALAIFLDKVQESKELELCFGGRKNITPDPKGKKMTPEVASNETGAGTGY